MADNNSFEQWESEGAKDAEDSGKAVTAKYDPVHFEKIERKGGQKVADLIERAKSLEGGEKAVVEERAEQEDREETTAGS